VRGLQYRLGIPDLPGITPANVYDICDSNPTIIAHDGVSRTFVIGSNIIYWTVADASDMPYANGTFDAITCGFALRNMQKYLDKVFAESCRVLKPDGFMIALDLTRPEGRARKALHGIYLKCALPVIGFIIYGRTSPFRYLGGSISGFYTAEEVKEKFLKAGFRECRYETAGFGAAGIYTAVK